MIGFKNNGRMGNFLWQAAACIGLALRNGVDFSMPNKTRNDFHSPLYLQHLVNPKWEQNRTDILINEQTFHFTPIEYKQEWNNSQVVLNGYWQSEKYWADFKKEVVEIFNFPWKPNEGFVSVHLRRTDFLTYKDKHPEVKDEWYNEAMALFPNKKYLFFSDEIDYCKKVWGHRDDCYFANGSIEQDMIDMSCCGSGHICSASTYAFWGMYLDRQEDKKVIFPQNWFCKNWDGADTKDILPEWVIKL